jgi:hypothetical protein
MTALGIDMTDREPTKGWASLTPTLHPVNHLHTLSVAAWKLASQYVDEGRSWDEIKRMHDTAVELEDLARSGDECNCVLPEQSCAVCRATARAVYEEEFNG